MMRVAHLEDCKQCMSSLAHSKHWWQMSDDAWTLLMRCPECHFEWLVIEGVDTLDRFQRVWNTGVDRLIDDLEAISNANTHAIGLERDSA